MLMQRQFSKGGKCTHVIVKHTGIEPEQNFSHRLVEQAVAEGWMRIDGTVLTVKAEPEDLVYTLKRRPGYYCSTTGERIPISDLAMGRMRATGIGDLTRQEALAWLASKGRAGGGYEVTNAYECVLGDEQHDQFRAVRAVSGNVVAAYTQEA